MYDAFAFRILAFRTLAFKAVTAIAAAAAITAAITAFPGVTEKVEASTPVPHAKADRLDARALGKDCSTRAWPYFETECLRQSGMAPLTTARLVTTDRL